MLLTIIFGFLAWYWITTLNQMRRMRDLPRSRAASAAQGEAEFEGYVWPAGVTIESLAGTPVIQRQLQLQHYVTGKNGGWRTLFQRQDVPAYFLVDDSGAVQIQNIFAPVRTEHDVKTLSAAGRVRLHEVLAAEGDAGAKALQSMGEILAAGREKIRYVEMVLPVGAKAYANGVFQTQTGDRRDVTSDELLAFVRITYGKTSPRVTCAGRLVSGTIPLFVGAGHEADVLAALKGKAVTMTIGGGLLYAAWSGLWLLAGWLG